MYDLADAYGWGPLLTAIAVVLVNAWLVFRFVTFMGNVERKLYDIDERVEKIAKSVKRPEKD